MSARRRRLAGRLALVFAAAAAPLAGQVPADSGRAAPTPGSEPPRVRAPVRQVAGSTLYFDLGARHGLAAGDTIPVFRDASARPLGALVVTAASDRRSVLTPVGGALAVAAGDTLVLVLRRPPLEAPGVAAVAAPAPRPTPPDSADPRPIAPRARPYGRVALELDAGRYLTRFEGAPEADRTYSSATPAFRFDVSVPDLGGGFRLRTGARLTYRYEAGPFAAQATSLRVYSLALERDAPGSRLRVGVGRFHSPAESYSGYWDGLHLRYGGAAGIGFLLGFQPDLWNERPSFDRPKATLVLDADRGGRRWRWSADASLHRVWGAPVEHTFVGLSQSLTVARLRLGHDVQLERDPVDAAWRLARGTVRSSLALGPAVEVHAGFARRAPLVEYADTFRWSPSDDRVSVGIGLGSGEARLSADVARMSGPTGTARSYSAYAIGPWLGAARLDGSVGWWEGGWGSSRFGAPSLTVRLGDAQLRAGYRYDRSEYLDRPLLTHGVEVSADFALGRSARATLRVRGQEGASTRSTLMDLSLYRSF